jgi:broad specificity phosphatase PhoE
MKNIYYILRHGQNVYQADKPGTMYPFPESSPIVLTEKGIKEVEDSAKKLKKENIDLIFSSDILRTRQTSKIVSKEVGVEVKLDKRLRDTNFGSFGDKKREEYLGYFSGNKERFVKAVPKGESWNDVESRVKDFLNEIENKYKGKKILLVSHGDTLWLFEGLVKEINKDDLLKDRDQICLKTGELRKIN